MNESIHLFILTVQLRRLITLSTLVIVVFPVIHADVFLVVFLGAVSHLVVGYWHIIVLRITFVIVVLQVIVHAHLLQLPHLVVHIEVKSASQVLEVGLLPFLKTVLEQLEIIEELQVQVVQLSDTLVIYLRDQIFLVEILGGAVSLMQSHLL